MPLPCIPLILALDLLGLRAGCLKLCHSAYLELKLSRKQPVGEKNNIKRNTTTPSLSPLKVRNKSPMGKYPPYARSIESFLITRVREFKAKKTV